MAAPRMAADYGWRWRVLVCEWGPTTDDRFMSRRLLEARLCELLPGKPFCAYLVNGHFVHVRSFDPAGEVGRVDDVRSTSVGLLATVTLDAHRPLAARVRRGLLRLEAERGLRRLGLSIAGRDPTWYEAGTTIVMENTTPRS